MIGSVIESAVEEVLGLLIGKDGERRPADLMIAALRPANPKHGEYSVNIAMQPRNDGESRLWSSPAK